MLRLVCQIDEHKENNIEFEYLQTLILDIKNHQPIKISYIARPFIDRSYNIQECEYIMPLNRLTYI
jgi:hypothetical protein